MNKKGEVGFILVIVAFLLFCFLQMQIFSAEKLFKKNAESIETLEALKAHEKTWHMPAKGFEQVLVQVYNRIQTHEDSIHYGRPLEESKNE